MYDIDASVGRTGRNKREDVFLVQYLLAIWMAHNNDPKLMPIIIAAPVVKPDGIFGDKTHGGIQALEQAFPHLVRDARVDPMGFPSSKIFLLNQLLFSAGGLRAQVPNLRVEFPRVLVPLLFKP